MYCLPNSTPLSAGYSPQETLVVSPIVHYGGRKLTIPRRALSNPGKTGVDIDLSYNLKCSELNHM